MSKEISKQEASRFSLGQRAFVLTLSVGGGIGIMALTENLVFGIISFAVIYFLSNAAVLKYQERL